VSNPKNHHYIPQNHIDRFRDAQGKFWFFDFQKPEKGVHHRNSGSIFAVRHHNTLLAEDGERSYSVEHELSKIEGQFSELVELIIPVIEAGETPKITSSERDFLSRYMEFQWRRSPDFENKKSVTEPTEVEITIFQQQLLKESGVGLSLDEARLLYSHQRGVTTDIGPEIVKIIRKIGGDIQETDEQIVEAMRGPVGERAKRSGRIAGRYADLDGAKDEFGALKKWWVRLSPNLSFVLGSNPVTTFSAKKQQYPHALNGIVFPVSSSIALVHGREDYPYVLEGVSDRDTVRKLNMLIVGQSDSFGSRSVELTKSLARH